MMNEETYLKERVGKENPFRVPDGYFDTLASQVMARIDAEAQEQPSKKAKVISMHRVFYYAAAAVCALFVCATVYFSFNKEAEAVEQQQVAVVDESADNYFDEAADYMMLDNQDIYACLASDY